MNTKQKTCSCMKKKYDSGLDKIECAGKECPLSYDEDVEKCLDTMDHKDGETLEKTMELILKEKYDNVVKELSKANMKLKTLGEELMLEREIVKCKTLHGITKDVSETLEKTMELMLKEKNESIVAELAKANIELNMLRAELKVKREQRKCYQSEEDNKKQTDNDGEDDISHTKNRL